MKAITTEANFYELINSEQPIVVKFYTNWCPDCVRMDYFIDEIISEFDQFTWYKTNRDDLSDVGVKYEVMGIPSLLVFKNGEKIGHLHSAYAKSPEEVTEFLEGILATVK